MQILRAERGQPHPSPTRIADLEVELAKTFDLQRRQHDRAALLTALREVLPALNRLEAALDAGDRAA